MKGEIGDIMSSMQDGEYPQWISIPFLIVSHWIFQGFIYMNRTERIFKLLVESVVLTTSFIVLPRDKTVKSRILISIAISHTINLIFNGQIWCVFKHFEYIKNDHEEFENWIRYLKEESERNKSIRAVIIIGSLTRDELSTTSDLDVRVIRYPGTINGFKASFMIMRERVRALIDVFPLDIFLFSKSDVISRIREEEAENLTIIYDPDNLFRNKD